MLLRRIMSFWLRVSFQNFGPLGGRFDFFISSRFEIQSGFDYKASEIKLHSVRAFKHYMNDKSLIHGQETVTISKGNVASGTES